MTSVNGVRMALKIGARDNFAAHLKKETFISIYFKWDSYLHTFFHIQFSIYISCRICYVFWASVPSRKPTFCPNRILGRLISKTVPSITMAYSEVFCFNVLLKVTQNIVQRFPRRIFWCTIITTPIKLCYNHGIKKLPNHWWTRWYYFCDTMGYHSNTMTCLKHCLFQV